MRIVEFMMGSYDFAKLTAGLFMQNTVSYYHDEDTGDVLARAITVGSFGSVLIIASDGRRY